MRRHKIVGESYVLCCCIQSTSTLTSDSFRLMQRGERLCLQQGLTAQTFSLASSPMLEHPYCTRRPRAPLVRKIVVVQIR